MAVRRTLLALSAVAFASPIFATSNIQSPMMASPSPSNLQVHIESAATPSTLKVTISNTHQSTPLTVLRWDIPSDRDARDCGYYFIQSTTSDEVKSGGLKKKRGLPAYREDLLEIPAQDQVTEELAMVKQWIPSDGGNYKVWAKGPWRAVWTKTKAEVTDEDLRTIIGDFGHEAEYETNIVELTLSG